MTRLTLDHIFFSSLKTCLLLILFELISSALFPALGLSSFKLPFNVLVVLYLAFKVNHPSVPFIILFLQFVHSAFSIEGWAVTTLIGLIVLFVLKYIKDLLDFSSAASTMIAVFLFHIFWFFCLAIFISIKASDSSLFMTYLFGAFFESLLITLFSPLIFKLLDYFWTPKKSIISG
ncbi:MAG: hypothetical protein N4A33_07090 [Bacteriovoracaceae bacterium]|jgi:hypothetical protein|nr:hypothetical protein [Bacteriovoracaceae bacterium]